MRKIIYLLLPAAFAFTVSFAPIFNRTITGKVTDDAGNPIYAASVYETGSKNATSTDAKGEFTLNISDKATTITIACVGFDSKTFNIEKSTVANITLTASSKSLQEVVVTAYGMTRKRSMTGSIATISPRTVTQVNTGYALSGKVAGLTITSASGAPGTQTSIKIRGMSSLNNDGKISRRDKKQYNKYLDSVDREFSREGYAPLVENPFLTAKGNPLSTFSIDVDAAAYSNVRRFINRGSLPPNGAVRTEEMINYFDYDYPQPVGDKPFSINTELAVCPWNVNHKLMMIGLQGKKVATHNLPPSNLVFLIDVSGSMQSEDKLPLVQQSLKLLVDNMREEDVVSIVTYAGNVGLVLPATNGQNKQIIKDAIDKLNAGGSTAGGQGIKLAYKIARENFMEQQNNRVILCTDGDFNVGVSSESELVDLIEEERESGIYLTVLGFGMGNYQDAKMQQLADKGNGNHAYIDSPEEAKKVLVKEFGGTLFTIAKDVKLQLEFNPAKVQAYRLIGYENRLLSKEDFNDDTKDAGELGSGHTVTALYEIIPVGIESSFVKNADELKYQKTKTNLTKLATSNELVTIKFRYKEPEKIKSILMVQTVEDKVEQINQASDNFRFAASVAQFAMLLRKSEYKGSTSYDEVISAATTAKGKDVEGYRTEFLKLVEKTKLLDKPKETAKLEKTDVDE
jgi:Ca-activated chloride channel family protein